MTSAELVTLPKQVVKESISTHKAFLKKLSAIILSVKLSLVGKQITLVSDLYKNINIVCQKIPYN